MRGNRRRLSGTWAIPSSTIRCAGVADQIDALHRDRARGRPDQARDDPHQRGLARAVRADDADRLARRAPRARRRTAPGSSPYPARTPFSSSIGPAAGGRDGAGGARLGAEVHLDHAGVGRDLGGEALGDLLAVVEHHHAVHHAHQDAHDVLDPDDRDVEVLRDPAQQSAAWSISCSSRPLRLSSASRSFGDVARALASSSFLSAAAPSPSTTAARSVGSPTSSSARSAASSARAPRVPALTEEAGEHHVLEDGEPAERPRDLEGAADAEVDDPVRRLPADLAPLEPDRSRRWARACRRAC